MGGNGKASGKKKKGGGGGGSVSESANSESRTVDKNSPITATEEREISTTMYKSQGGAQRSFKNEVLEATTDSRGNLTFDYPSDVTYHAPSAKTNRTSEVTYRVKAGAVDGETFGINWNNVNSISGKTYSLRQAAKENGLKWNSDKKIWERR